MRKLCCCLKIMGVIPMNSIISFRFVFLRLAISDINGPFPAKDAFRCYRDSPSQILNSDLLLENLNDSEDGQHGQREGLHDRLGSLNETNELNLTILKITNVLVL